MTSVLRFGYKMIWAQIDVLTVFECVSLKAWILMEMKDRMVTKMVWRIVWSSTISFIREASPCMPFVAREFWTKILRWHMASFNLWWIKYGFNCMPYFVYLMPLQRLIHIYIFLWHLHWVYLDFHLIYFIKWNISWLLPFWNLTLLLFEYEYIIYLNHWSKKQIYLNNG